MSVQIYLDTDYDEVYEGYVATADSDNRISNNAVKR